MMIVLTKKIPVSPSVWGNPPLDARYKSRVSDYLRVERIRTVKKPTEVSVDVEFAVQKDRLKQGNDIDNLIKCFFDSLTENNVWEADSQVSSIVAKRVPVSAQDDEYVAVTVRTLD